MDHVFNHPKKHDDSGRFMSFPGLKLKKSPIYSSAYTPNSFSPFSATSFNCWPNTNPANLWDNRN